MIVHNFDPVFIDLGVFQIRWYSIAYIVGIILGWIYAIKIIKEMAKKHNFTMIKQTVFDDLIIYLIIGIVLGGRLGYVIFYNFDYYSKNFIEILIFFNNLLTLEWGSRNLLVRTGECNQCGECCKTVNITAVRDVTFRQHKSIKSYNLIRVIVVSVL